MHELSLCAGIVDVLREQARTHDYARVKTVRLEVGELAGVEVEALRFGFDVAARGTLADGATLDIVAVPGSAWCVPCAREVSTRHRFDPCPCCGGHRLRLLAGDELRIKELEVE